MRKIFVIAVKELRTYFRTPMAYIILVVTISVFNVFFFMIIDQNREADLRDVFQIMEFLFVFIVPLLTMKVFSEEKMTGTMEFLMTSPTTNTAIILGKYLGSLMFLTFMIILTFVYYFIIEFFGRPDRLAVFVGYLGVWLEGAFFMAIGLLTSSWTRNQIIAAISSYAILFLLYFSISWIKYLDGTIADVVQYLSTWSHSQNLIAGLLTTADVIYYLSGIFFCITLMRLSVENRLWRH